MLINRFYAGYMPKHIRKWLKDRQPHIPDQPDIPDQPTNIIVDIPIININNFEFNNTEQSIVIPINNGYIIEGTFSATNAGEYKVILKLNDGYVWSDKTFENKEITWQITQADNKWEILPELTTTSWREDEEAGKVINTGTAKFGEVKVTLDGEDYDINNPLPTESDKQYELKFIVEETPNYKGLIQTITFEIIDRPDISEPNITDKTYTGNPHYIITVDDTFTVDGDISATDVGEYSFTVTPKDGYEWPDNTDETKTFTWRIIKATNDWTTEPFISKLSWYENDTNPGVLTNGEAKFGEVVIKLNNEDFTNLPTEPGNYTIEFIVDETDNYSGLNKTITFEILKYDEPILPDIPDETDITINPEYGEVITGLGENQDEVAVIFKNADLENMEWTVPCNLENVEFLAVGGGGAGGGAATYGATEQLNGSRGGGGGGGGGVVTGTITTITKGDKLLITVGKGGIGGKYVNSTSNGTGAVTEMASDTTVFIGETRYIKAGAGGSDTGYNTFGGTGASSSGSRDLDGISNVDLNAFYVNNDFINEVQTFGNKGGYGNHKTVTYAAGGGGGASGVGVAGSSASPYAAGKGGAGLSSDITGNLVIYGAGGGGGNGYNGNGGAGGDGVANSGAGNGGSKPATTNYSSIKNDGSSALANQGGGGGGGGYRGDGGNGGSGVVVLRFKANNLKIDPNVIKIKLTSPNVNSVINTVSKKIVNDMKNDDVFLNESTYYTYDTDYRKDAALESEKNSVPIEFNWLNTTGDTSLKLWRTKDIEADLNSEPLFQLTTSNTSAIYYDPEVGRNYTYEITDSNNNILSGNFYTAQLVPRVIYANQDPNTVGAEGSNTRDIGGWLTTDGTKMVKQGIIYRSAMLEWCSARSNEKIIVPNIHLQDNLGIRVELDLRELDHIKTHFIDKGWKCSWKLDESMAITDSTIGPKIERYCPNANGFAASPSYDSMFSDNENKKSIYASFNKIYESIINNKPILFHCSQGKDRTGCLAYILLGMLGVSETNARRDYAFTYYSQNKVDVYMTTSGEGFYSLTNSVLNNLPTGNTFQDRCKAYIKQCGEIAGDSEVDTKITNFIEFMLEDIEVF